MRRQEGIGLYFSNISPTIKWRKGFAENYVGRFLLLRLLFYTIDWIYAARMKFASGTHKTKSDAKRSQKYPHKGKISLAPWAETHSQAHILLHVTKHFMQVRIYEIRQCVLNEQGDASLFFKT